MHQSLVSIGWGMAWLMVGAMTFWMLPHYRGCTGVVISRQNGGDYLGFIISELLFCIVPVGLGKKLDINHPVVPTVRCI